MAAPITKLLFLFVLGITSWSRYATANKVTVTGCTGDLSDGNGVIDSMECSIEDNKLKSTINVKGCPGVPQLTMQLLNDDAVMASGGKALNDVNDEMGKFCNYVDAPSGDESCSIGEGDIELSGCDIEQYVSDNNPGTYVAKIDVADDNTSFGTFIVEFTIE